MKFTLLGLIAFFSISLKGFAQAGPLISGAVSSTTGGLAITLAVPGSPSERELALYKLTFSTGPVLTGALSYAIGALLLKEEEAVVKEEIMNYMAGDGLSEILKDLIQSMRELKPELKDFSEEEILSVALKIISL